MTAPAAALAAALANAAPACAADAPIVSTARAAKRKAAEAITAMAEKSSPHTRAILREQADVMLK